MIINCRCHLTIVALDAAAVSGNIRYPMIDLLKAPQTSRVWILIKMSSLRIFFYLLFMKCQTISYLKLPVSFRFSSLHYGSVI
jgi:hypothetical protein